MILTEEKLNVIKSNLPGKTTAFKIALSAKAFKDLYSSRYSNKIQAVMREIACNAADSHVEVGTPNRPIIIHLPNKLEPWLAFQDFGPGLSEERLEQVYTTCYASTKSSSNSETGCFGVGSKSVFCYSDNFQVRNRHNKIEYNYSLFIDENGIPNITCLSEEPTEEENGLTVTVNVEEEDFQKFYDEAEKVFSVFSPLPIITGHKINMSKPKYFEETPEFGITGNRQSRIIQANVQYPIPRSFNNIFDNGCDVYVPNGTFMPTSSREAIEFDGVARKKLNAIANKINAYYTDKFSKDMLACTDLWSAMCLQYKLQNEFSFLALNLKWNNEPVPTKINIERFSYVDGKHTKRSKNLIFPMQNGRRRKKHQTEIRPSGLPKVLIIDTGDINYLPSRFDTYCRQNGADGYFVSNPDLAELTALGLDPLILDPKNLPAHVPSPRGPSANKGLVKTDFYELCSGSTYFDSWQEADFTDGVPEFAVYVQLTGFQWTLEDGKKRTTEDAKRCQNMLEKLFSQDTPVYAVRANGLKKIPPGWVRLESYVDIALDKYKGLAKHCRYNFGEWAIDQDVLRNGQSLDLPVLKAFKKRWESTKKEKDKFKSWENLLEFKVKASVTKPSLISFDKLLKASLKGLPLLKDLISKPLGKETLNELNTYIRLKRQGAFRVVTDEAKQLEALPVTF